MCRELILSFHIYVCSRDWIQATRLQFYLTSCLAVAPQSHAPQLDSWESKRTFLLKFLLWMSEIAKIIYLCKDIGISTLCQRELKCILCFQSGEKPQVMQCVNPNINLSFKVRQHPEAADRSVLMGRIGFFHVNKRVVRAPLGKIWHLFVLVEFHS